MYISLSDCVFRYIRRQVLDNGATGRVAFDDNGDRIYAEYDIVNVKAYGERISVGQYYYSQVRDIQNALFRPADKIRPWHY